MTKLGTKKERNVMVMAVTYLHRKIYIDIRMNINIQFPMTSHFCRDAATTVGRYSHWYARSFYHFQYGTIHVRFLRKDILETSFMSVALLHHDGMVSLT